MQHKVSYISNLTPLRGIAALLVAIFHFEMAVARFIPVNRTMFFEKSYLMVDLFFIMSGFILLHVYRENFKDGVVRAGYRPFLVARFARIYPLHFFSLSLLILFVLFLPSGDNQAKLIEAPSAIPAGYLLINSFYVNSIYTWNIPSWSISPEWWSYMIFPWLAFFICQKKAGAILIYLIFIIAAYYSIMYLLPRKNPLYPGVPVQHNINTTYDYGFLRGLAGFMIGMIINSLYQSPVWKKVFGGDLVAILLLLCTAAALHFALSDLIAVLCFALVVFSFASNKNLIHRICQNRVLQYFGNISYSIYLMQIFFQVPFSHGYRLPGTTGLGRGKLNIEFWPGMLYCGIYLFLLIGLATITCNTIEKPFRKLINQKWG